MLIISLYWTLVIVLLLLTNIMFYTVLFLVGCHMNELKYSICEYFRVFRISDNSLFPLTNIYDHKWYWQRTSIFSILNTLIIYFRTRSQTFFTIPREPIFFEKQLLWNNISTLFFFLISFVSLQFSTPLPVRSQTLSNVEPEPYLSKGECLCIRDTVSLDV